MTRVICKPSTLHTLTHDAIEQHLPDLLCDDSWESHREVLLVRPDFQPDSFTVWDRFKDDSFLPETERHADVQAFLALDVAAKLGMLESEGFLTLDEGDECVEFIVRQLSALLEYPCRSGTVASEVYNQEFTDVSRRVIAYCLTGEPNHELPSHVELLELGKRITPLMLERHFSSCRDLKDLLCYSIASGLVGLDLKGPAAAASPMARIENMDIPLGQFVRAEADASRVADFIFERLRAVAARGLVVDDWAMFTSAALAARHFKLCWFADDFIETLFDLMLAQRLLEENPALEIYFIPKNGWHGNDASYSDVAWMLRLPVFDPLSSFLRDQRFRLSEDGPRMATVNLRKVSPVVVEEIRSADAVYVKGCRGHEMVQGGIDAVTYTAFVVAREFTESETGLDARSCPLVFFRSEPGEYGYWGFKGTSTRRKQFPDGKAIRICHSTLEEHRLRKTTNDVALLIGEIEQLLDLQATVQQEYRHALALEAAGIMDRLSIFDRRACAELRERYPGFFSQPAG